MTDLPKSNDLTATWTFVEPGLELIIGGNDENAGVNPKMYMNVYSAIYNFCIKKSSSATSLSSNAANQSSLLVGGEIYKKLSGYLISYVKLLKKRPNETFLEFYVRRWTRFTVGAGYLNHVFDYMNRYWIQKERSDGRREIYDVNTLALLTWRDHLFDKNIDILTKEILEQIKLQRDNQVVDNRTLSVAIRSFVLLGIDTNDLKKPNLNVYIEKFEAPFLESTRQYYTSESAEYLTSHNVIDYMKKAEQRINEEETRETLYLDEHSKKPLTDCLNETLIVNHSEIMYKEFTNLLDQNQIEHIAKMFSLFNRIPSTLDPLAATFSEYIKIQGNKAIENLKNDYSNELNKNGITPTSILITKQIDPKQYIRSLIQVYKTFQDIVATAFQNNPIFVKALDSACRDYINENSIAKPNGSRQNSRTPDLLAKYSDTLLKRSKDADSTTDMSVDDIMIIFKFLTDKDAFEANYRRLLAKRLIHGSSSSEEAEESVVQRLQSENSLEYTSKITRMFQDVRASHDLRNLFKEETSKDLNFSKSIVPDFEPYILTEMMWPFNHTDSKFQLPNVLTPTFTKLQQLYQNKHNGRILKWQWSLCRGDVRANLSRPGKAPFTFSLSLYQMAILLPFNESESYSLGEIVKLTGLELNVISNQIAPLVKHKVLIQSTGSTLDDLYTRIKICTEYKAKRLKINFAGLVKNTEQKQEQEDTEREINDDRKMYIKACIVRIMKTRKQLLHNLLINEVIQQTHQRFSAKISDIKKCVDELVEKEYLSRNEDQTYDYLA
ncbi:hypothetical protein WICMUC_003475 [Wickerhamomyces mucosus]|uniref:Cullin family profile domain-containing protein n=1 Tax=Wickerhamomyces mucosus TaxID=1378264 RepID=A0A9P8PL08_9ASCO|nr:hypothetical protein WICMUC_003475 [Wickerhamomyces mucosus]